MADKYTTVLMPIEVPQGKYCWKFHEPVAVCPHFSNYGGSACDLGMTMRHQTTSEGVPKPEQCSSLVEATDDDGGELAAVQRQLAAVQRQLAVVQQSIIKLLSSLS